MSNNHTWVPCNIGKSTAQVVDLDNRTIALPFFTCQLHITLSEALKVVKPSQFTRSELVNQHLAMPFISIAEAHTLINHFNYNSSAVKHWLNNVVLPLFKNMMQKGIKS